MGALQKALASYTPPSNTAGASAQPAPQPASPTATPDSSASQATPQQILMIAPTGEKAYVPQDRVADYEAKGGQVGIRMVAPDGKEKAIVPFDRQDTYQKQGATWDSSPDNDAAKTFLAQRTLTRANANMTAAMSGQPMSTPEDQAQFDAGRKAGLESGAVTTLTSLGGELLAAPKLLQVAARDPATGQFVRGLATKEGPTLLAQSIHAISAAGDAHPLVKQALISGLTMLGAGKIAHLLGWLGKETGGK